MGDKQDLQNIVFIPIDIDSLVEKIALRTAEIISKDLKKEADTQSEKEDLMTRDEVLDLLKINASTLWHWQNRGRIKVHKFANKCYYKRSEIMASLILLKK